MTEWSSLVGGSGRKINKPPPHPPFPGIRQMERIPSDAPYNALQGTARFSAPEIPSIIRCLERIAKYEIQLLESEKTAELRNIENCTRFSNTSENAVDHLNAFKQIQQTSSGIPMIQMSTSGTSRFESMKNSDARNSTDLDDEPSYSPIVRLEKCLRLLKFFQDKAKSAEPDHKRQEDTRYIRPIAVTDTKFPEPVSDCEPVENKDEKALFKSPAAKQIFLELQRELHAREEKPVESMQFMQEQVHYDPETMGPRTF